MWEAYGGRTRHYDSAEISRESATALGWNERVKNGEGSVDKRVDLTIQQREAVEAEINRRTLAHRRRVARLKRGARLRAETRKAVAAATRFPGDRRFVVRLSAEWQPDGQRARRRRGEQLHARRHPRPALESLGRRRRLGEPASSLPNGVFLYWRRNGWRRCKPSFRAQSERRVSDRSLYSSAGGSEPTC
jgi:hypothetical protein